MNNSANVILSCENVNKSYQDGQLKVDVIHNLNLTVKAGEGISIVGASGSGKSTLLHILGGLDTPTSGSIRLMNQDILGMSQTALGKLRNQYLGFVYQFHHLMPEFTALENVMMPLLIAKKSRNEARERSEAMLKKVGMENRVMHRPSELSGGERQRAAIARALVSNPACLLADEPTGNLDRKNADHIMGLILELQKEMNAALVVVTHDDQLALQFDQYLRMNDGSLSPIGS